MRQDSLHEGPFSWLPAAPNLSRNGHAVWRSGRHTSPAGWLEEVAAPLWDSTKPNSFSAQNLACAFYSQLEDDKKGIDSRRWTADPET